MFQGHGVIRHTDNPRGKTSGKAGIFDGLQFKQNVAGNHSIQGNPNWFGVSFQAQPQEDFAISIQGNSWYFVTGFKYSINF